MKNRFLQLQNRLACKQGVKKSSAFFDAGFTPTPIISLFQGVFVHLFQKSSQLFHTSIISQPLSLKQKTPRCDWCRGFTPTPIIQTLLTKVRRLSFFRSRSNTTRDVQLVSGFTPTPIVRGLFSSNTNTSSADSHSSNNTKNVQLVSGFTVLEMVTVIAIFTLLLGITMSNFDLFKKVTDFNLSAQEVGFLIKNQQQNAMAGRFPEIDPYLKNYPSTTWRPAYGLYFNKLTPDRVIQFYDADNDFLLTTANGAPSCANDADYECIKEIIFDKMLLTSIREMNPAGPIQKSSLSVVFKRPFPDARMNTDYTAVGVFNATDVPTPISNTVELRFESPGVTGANIVSINPLGVLTVRRSPL